MTFPDSTQISTYQVNATAVTVPEPGTTAPMVAGLAGVVGLLALRSKRRA